ncbi:protein of unknown function [Duganella sp. CF517]|uniref:eCIS core domain-containing protein n=1 Tax=Duganella sp. CF517 TaxID=1881038 RepID=UPI0008C202B9|nr:DUF4157 domain-containing protein [Duganella sp. CF517]SEN77187.1 protein of unknown function [Duganella sp. CF517]
MSYSSYRRQSKSEVAQPVAQRHGAASIMDQRASAADHLQLKQKIDGSAVANASRPVKQLMVDEEELEGAAPAQLMEDEDKTLQGKFAPVQRAAFEDDETLQGKFTGSATAQLAENQQAQVNNTGLPDQLKSGIENLSGMSMDHVKVHYNSAQPAQLNAHAYAQGSDIHVAPGQERHLPHEAWHVVQQAQGRVNPTMQLKAGIAVNDEVELETEADVMGGQALRIGHVSARGAVGDLADGRSNSPLQTKGSIQRFADDANAERRKEVTGGDAQLDHAISQDTLDDFWNVLSTLKQLLNTSKPEQLAPLMAQLDALYKQQDIKLKDKNAILNIRNNITPGYRNTIGNPGFKYDHQVEIYDDDSVAITEQSEQLEKMDRAIRSLTRQLPIIKKLAVVDMDETADAFVAKIDGNLKTITATLEYLNGDKSTKPRFDKDLWYGVKGKKVKKVPAEYIGVDDPLLHHRGANKQLLGVDLQAIRIRSELPLSSYKIESNGRTGRKEVNSIRRTNPVVAIETTISEKAWAHIYNRHTIDGFAGEVKAINTFWKYDPKKILTAHYDKVLAELMLIIDRQMDLAHGFATLDEGAEFENPINEAGAAFFFQGKYVGTSAYTLAIELESFAPQSPEFAYGVLPSAELGHEQRKFFDESYGMSPGREAESDDTEGYA